MLLVMSTQADEVAQKNELKKEEKELQEELDSYEYNIFEFTRARSDTLNKINMEVKVHPGVREGFVAPTTPGPLRKPAIKCVAHVELKLDVLMEHSTMVVFFLWEEELLNWFEEVYQGKGTNS